MPIQMKENLAIDIISARVPEERCLAALSFRGGTACSYFAIIDNADDEDSWDGEGGESTTMFQANRAFWHVFKAYVSELDEMLVNGDVFLDSASTMISWDFASPTGAAEAWSALFALEPEEGLFDKAKEKAFSEYASKFSNPLFRFTHKILEQTEAAFGFTYEAFTTDFENITFDEFKAAWDILVIPDNALACIMAGDTDQAQAAMDRLELPAPIGNVVAMPVEPVVPLDRQMEITLPGSSLFDLGALCFESLSGFTPSEKKICLEVINQHFFGGAGSISVDLFDASIIFTEEEKKKDYLDAKDWQIDEGEFASIVDAVGERLHKASRRFPRLFVAEQARDSQQGINNVAIMQILPRIPFKAFAERLAGAFAQVRQIRISQICEPEEMLAV